MATYATCMVPEQIELAAQTSQCAIKLLEIQFCSAGGGLKCALHAGQKIARRLTKDFDLMILSPIIQASGLELKSPEGNMLTAS